MSSLKECTCVLIKPDAVQRGLIGEIVSRIEKKGYLLTEIKMLTPSIDLVRNHYLEHTDKPYFNALCEYMAKGPVVALRVEGRGVVRGFRLLAGATSPQEALAGTIRGDFARLWESDLIQNLVHGSDSPESAERELEIWFGQKTCNTAH